MPQPMSRTTEPEANCVAFSELPQESPLPMSNDGPSPPGDCSSTLRPEADWDALKEIPLPSPGEKTKPWSVCMRPLAPSEFEDARGGGTKTPTLKAVEVNGVVGAEILASIQWLHGNLTAQLDALTLRQEEMPKRFLDELPKKGISRFDLSGRRGSHSAAASSCASRGASEGSQAGDTGSCTSPQHEASRSKHPDHSHSFDDHADNLRKNAAIQVAEQIDSFQWLSRQEEEERASKKSKSGLPLFREWMKHLIVSSSFELSFAMMIITNSVVIGLESDNQARSVPGSDPPLSFFVIRQFYALIFLFELVCRLIADGRSFFWSSQWMWNYLDLFIVASSVFEACLDLVKMLGEVNMQGVGGMSNMRIVRLIRITRLLRIFRITRLIRFIKALQTLVYSIMCTLKALVWAMFLLVGIMYVFAILFTQATTEYLSGLANEDEKGAVHVLLIKQYWSNLSVSMFTLFKAISNGLSWDVVVEPLAIIHPIWGWIFTLFIVFAYFAVLNVVTGVFCQSAIDAAQHDQDMMVHTVLANKKMYISNVKKLFTSIDSDSSGFITMREFEEYTRHTEVQACFDALELDTSDAWALFKLLDADETHQIDIEEFIDGCLRLKGAAKSVDMVKLMHENKIMRGTLLKFMSLTERRLAKLCDEDEDLHHIVSNSDGDAPSESEDLHLEVSRRSSKRVQNSCVR